MSLRPAAVALVLLAGAVAGCVPIPPPSLTAPASATLGPPSPSPTPTAVPSAASSLSPWTGPYPVVRLPGHQIRTVSLPLGFSIHRSSADGPRVVFDQTGYGTDDTAAGRSVYFADLSDGTLRTIGTAAGGDAAWTPVISGEHVAWVEWRYADNVHFTGDLTWRIMVMRLPAGEPRELVAGVNRRLEGGQGVPPLLSIDGDELAYTIESPTASHPLGWKIVVRDVVDGSVRRSLQTGLSVYSMALSDGQVAYSEGLVDQAGNFKYRTRLMFWKRGTTTAVKVADDAFEVAFRGSLLAWVGDELSSRGQVGLAQRPRVFVASMDDLKARPAGHDADGIVDWGGLWPAAGDGYATWADNQDTPSHPDPSGDHLVIWDTRTGRAYQLEPTAGLDLSGVGNGWLVWHSEWDPVPVWHGVRLDAITLPTSP